ncbi:MAG: PDZ domain-containing protein [Clostridiales bacterium]|nr:PDZ domain-containing protein [Clostridiales bacterium]
MIFRRKLLTFFITFTVIVSAFCGFGYVAKANSTVLYLGGIPAGFTIKTNGAEVVGISEIATIDGISSPAKNADIKIGDIITEIGKEKICGAESVAEILSKCDGSPLEITVVRKGEKLTKFLTPKADGNGNYKLGVFLREDLSGIGTITYFTNDGDFVALGHPILNENGDFLDLKSGTSYVCSIIGLEKGLKGKAGELKGIFLSDTKIGCILYNSKSGIYGNADKSFDFKSYPKTEICNAQMGKATVFTCIDGITPKEYAINIVKVDSNNRENKNFVIKVVDKTLLNVTGGILQGMSGSPIIQQGKIVGAVTHVFVNDPTRGYGISIDKMIENQNK